MADYAPEAPVSYKDLFDSKPELFLPKTQHPAEAAFVTWSAKTGKRHLIWPFSEFLSKKVSGVETSSHAELQTDAKAVFAAISENADLVKNTQDTLNHLGLSSHIVVTGERAHLVKSILKANKFGSPTPKVNIPQSDTDAILPTNRTHLHISEDSYANIPSNLTQINTESLLQELNALATIPEVQQLLEKHAHNKEARKVLQWAADQAIIRTLLPRQPQLEHKPINLDQLVKIKELGGSGSTSENFQASNPSWICEDPDTKRKFIAKKCPEHTIQTDVFGLKVLEFHGVPTYDYYFTRDPIDGRAVLVSGFLEGYKDPADVIDFDESVPPSKRKTVLPPELIGARSMQRGLLAEVLIGEYNSKAHNMMVDELNHEDFVHFDQGGALTSTASGKFKPFNPELSIQDFDDVLNCYTDWDPSQKEPVNPAYDRIVSVKNNQLIIHDIGFAKELLSQERNIPIEWYHKALEASDFTDGPQSIQRLEQWLQDIDEKLIPKYQAMPESERKQQYLRWSAGAKANFQTAIQLGGELSFYKYALQKRRERLLNIWEKGINEAEKRTKLNRPKPPEVSIMGSKEFTKDDKQQLGKRWWSAWDTVISHNQGRSNLIAAATLYVDSFTNPNITEKFPNSELTQPSEKYAQLLSPPQRQELIDKIVRNWRLLEIPLSSKGALKTLETLSKLGNTSIWTTGDVSDSADHNLPSSLFDSAPLPGSREQVYKLKKAGIFNLRRKLGNNSFRIEAHNDKLAELPRMVEDAVKQGKTDIYIIDDSFGNLEAATNILKDYPIQLHLIYTNQGRKRTPDHPQLNLENPNHYYHPIDQFDQAVKIIEQSGTDPESVNKRAILCDFDGVITDNTAVRTRQEDFVVHTLHEAFNQPPDKTWIAISELGRADFGYEAVLPRIEEARRLGYTIVVTNGVFDLIHPGHVDYLNKTRAVGGKKAFVVVGVNSNQSARDQGKSGPERPIIDEVARAQTILGLDSTDAVVIFNNTTADELLRNIKPDLYVKGGDYTLEDNPTQDPNTGKTIRPLPERFVLQEIGAKAAFINIVPGQSTSAIINKILSPSRPPTPNIGATPTQDYSI
jgi:D-glycero-beta-D-manno-heptose 1-phosphate adenylyltransferase